MGNLTNSTAFGENGPIVLNGAGIAGGYLAALLGKLGHQVHVYERRSDPRSATADEGKSINFAIAERGLFALERLGLIEATKALSVPMRDRIIHADGQVNAQPYGIYADEVLLSIDRGAMNGLLLSAAEATGNVKIFFNKKCTKVDLDTKEMHIVDRFDENNKEVVPFTTIIGTDGAGSVVREAIVQAGASESHSEMLQHDYIEMEIPAGPNNSFLIEANGLHIWPRNDYMLIALANPSGDFTATLFMAEEGEGASFAAIQTAEQAKAFLNEQFPDFCELVPDHVEQYLQATRGPLGTIRCKGWSYKDTAVLVGDSAHGVVPFHGQGANAALESAAALVDHIQANPNDLEAAFVAYEADRRDDATAIADMAIENYIEMRDSVVNERYLIKRELALYLGREEPEYFRARYNLVMFSNMPYARAKQRGALQNELLNKLTEGLEDFEQIDLEAAKEAARELGRLDYSNPDRAASAR